MCCPEKPRKMGYRLPLFSLTGGRVARRDFGDLSIRRNQFVDPASLTKLCPSRRIRSNDVAAIVAGIKRNDQMSEITTQLGAKYPGDLFMFRKAVSILGFGLSVSMLRLVAGGGEVDLAGPNATEMQERSAALAILGLPEDWVYSDYVLQRRVKRSTADTRLRIKAAMLLIGKEYDPD